MRGTPKSIGALIAAGMLVACMAGCSSQDAAVDSADNTSATAQTEAASEENAEPAPLKEVTFGTYEGEPVTWLVLEEKDGASLLVSKDVLDARAYDDVDEGVQWAETSPRPTTDVNWADSSMREWLNGEFLNAAFSSDEQGAIKEVTNTDTKNNGGRNAADFDSESYSTAPESKDRVFLLSVAEARKYFADDAARVAFPTDHAVEAGVYTGIATDESGAENAELSGAAAWWLRTNGYYAGYEAVVTDDGYIHGDGYRINGEVHDGYEDHGTEASELGHNFGVRPCVWVDTAALA
ncbi:DUF6273 domain-containing protein [Xiamenia xianingshaonis]|uniref:DUF6273 domain-containing protein n=1 Tax=Xiamenia xianingshaonis TaxID=2682776 RepID=A0A9E6SUP0_9ACTN|nr:DUF6273 domain-containing protein [Xiamenia xianingshaonis]NHM13228.1 hypothetical protein [Xiamenia xianingshaonis]NHM15400.1 hypothetical protein [Xiamenia xianingshaonis]QTU84683.1 hypothetical protein J7S26_01790 [Xiamenia xianingshaonis]